MTDQPDAPDAPDEKPLRSALVDKHEAMAATMGDEAGWRVPLSFRGPLAEAQTVRSRAGAFDLSHLGRVRVRGDGALALLKRACTADVAHQEDDTATGTLLCNERGGVIDLCRLIRLSDFWVLVTSAACREKVLAHLQGLGEPLGAKVDDQTTKTTMLAVAGPAAPDILDAVLPFRVGQLGEGTVKFGTMMIARYIAERVDFAGVWGVRVSIPNMLAGQAWRFITAKAGDSAVAPCGLAALDVLRIEAGRPRYGHELTEAIDPISAGLKAAVDFGHDFLGRDAVQSIAETGSPRKPVGLAIEAPAGPADAAAIPRLGWAVRRADGSEVGTVTSGAYSPALERPIALAYVARAAAEPTEAGSAPPLTVAAEGSPLPARVVELPFVRADEPNPPA